MNGEDSLSGVKSTNDSKKRFKVGRTNNNSRYHKFTRDATWTLHGSLKIPFIFSKVLWKCVHDTSTEETTRDDEQFERRVRSHSLCWRKANNNSRRGKLYNFWEAFSWGDEKMPGGEEGWTDKFSLVYYTLEFLFWIWLKCRQSWYQFQMLHQSYLTAAERHTREQQNSSLWWTKKLNNFLIRNNFWSMTSKMGK